MVAKGHRVTKDRIRTRRSVSRDRLDSAEQKVSPIRKSQIELSSQAARHPRSNRDSSARIKGEDRDKRSQVSCGTYSQPLNRVSLQAVCARFTLFLFFFFQRGFYRHFLSFPDIIFFDPHTHIERHACIPFVVRRFSYPGSAVIVQAIAIQCISLRIQRRYRIPCTEREIFESCRDVAA